MFKDTHLLIFKDPESLKLKNGNDTFYPLEGTCVM